MAILVPSLDSCLPRMTGGERRFARLLASHLEDDYFCWYEMPVGVRRRYTDFIVLHPGRGLLLLEVKDWTLDTIHAGDSESFTLRLQSGEKRVPNPLAQVRQCTYQLLQQLERDPALRHENGPHRGKLVCPYAFGVVLTAISRAEFEAHDFDRVLPGHLVVCKDEMVQSVDAEAFQTRLWNMFPYHFRTPLSLPQIERVRWHLFPEIRIDQPVQLELHPETDDSADARPEPTATGEADEDLVQELFPDVVRLMDVRQERLARSLGTGHRVIHGVAGSGKTLILGYRCVHLANLVAKPILVLCFNITLAAWLRESMAERGLAERVHVRHFHDWCGDQLRSYHVERPPNGPGYVESSVRRVIEAVADGRIPRAQYGAVMIDEGHDFEPDWLRLVVSMVDPDSDSVLLLYDDAQSIYTKRRELGFSLKSVGVRAQGRTTVLRLNYRNTEEILSFAYRFAREWLAPEEAHDDGVPLIAPETGGRRGPEPAVRVLDDHDAEASLVARTAASVNARGTAWGEIAILYPETWMGEALARELERQSVPFHWLKTPRDKRALSRSDDRVKLMTIHSSKGLEFPFVAVAGVGRLPRRGQDVAGEAKLLYVAMTRATERLLVTAHGRSDFVERLAA